MSTRGSGHGGLVPGRWLSAFVLLAGTCLLLVLHTVDSPIHVPGDVQTWARPVLVMLAVFVLGEHAHHLLSVDAGAWPARAHATGRAVIALAQTICLAAVAAVAAAAAVVRRAVAASRRLPRTSASRGYTGSVADASNPTGPVVLRV